MARERGTKVTRSRGGGFSIKFGSSREEQAAAGNFISMMAGRAPAPCCAACGGLPRGEGPAAGECNCAPVQDPA